MIKLVNFLLLIKKITDYSKKEIDKGNTPANIYELCLCIKETFCLSYSIRKDNNLYFYFEKEYILIRFKGNNLKFLGPDERSQALLLDKALNKAKQIISIESERWEKSTPGIHVKKYSDNNSFMNSFISNKKGKIYFIVDHLEETNKKVILLPLDKNFIAVLNNDFYIIPTYSILKKNTTILELFKTLKNIKILSLPKIKLIENKILYLNFRKD